MMKSLTNKFAMAGVCCASLFATDAIAQDENTIEVQMAVDDESGAGPIVISSSRMAFAGDGEGGESTFEVFTGGDMMMGDFMSGGNIDPLSLLNNKDVREELELVGDQLEKYQQAQKDLQDQIREKTKALTSGEIDPASMGMIAKEIGEMQKAGQKQMQAMLLPHQLERLKQVALQMQMQKRGAAKTLLSDQIAEELGIDDAQKKRIEERQKELKKELAERMEKLKLEIREKLLAELTSEQKSKLEKLSGDKFDYKPTSMKERIQKRLEGRGIKIGG